MTLACALSLPPISSLNAPGWSSPEPTAYMHHHADGFWSVPGPSRTPRLPYANANELSSALESFTLSSAKKPSAAAPIILSAMPTATHKRASPRSRSVNPYNDHQKQPRSPSLVETTFVSQNTGDMMCYLWFSTNLSASRPPAALRTEHLAEEGVPLAVRAELARLQFSPSSHFITFLGTLLSTTQVSQGVIILSLYYIYRLKMLNTHIRGLEGSEFRLAVIALMLANKFLDDNTYTNKTWSEVSGITLTEINLMEREFLQGIDHRLYIDFGTFQHWGKLLSGLLLAKEREAQSWRRQTNRRISKHSHLSPIAPRSHPQQDPSSRYARTQRARSTSPLSSIRLAPVPYPFTFAAPPIAQINPFSQPAKTDGYRSTTVSPSRPAGPTGAKRSAVDAFTPLPMAPLKLPKREDLPVISTSNLVPQSNRTSSAPWENRSSPIIDSPMDLTPVDSDMSGSPFEAIKIERTERPRQQTLQAPFPHDHERWQSIARPQYLTFNALASSPSGTPDRIERRAGAGARKTVLRYQEPPAAASIHQYHPNYQQFAPSSSHRLDQIQTPMYSQSARTSPRDDTPASNYSQESYIFNNNLNDNHPPHSVYSRNVPPSTSTSFLQPRQSLPATASRIPSPQHQFDGRRLQFAPFANAGPPGVQHWTSGFSSLSNYADPPTNQYHSNWRLNGATAVGSTELGSPVMRGRKM